MWRTGSSGRAVFVWRGCGREGIRCDSACRIAVSFLAARACVRARLSMTENKKEERTGGCSNGRITPGGEESSKKKVILPLRWEMTGAKRVAGIWIISRRAVRLSRRSIRWLDSNWKGWFIFSVAICCRNYVPSDAEVKQTPIWMQLNREVENQILANVFGFWMSK